MQGIRKKLVCHCIILNKIKISETKHAPIAYLQQDLLQHTLSIQFLRKPRLCKSSGSPSVSPLASSKNFCILWSSPAKPDSGRGLGQRAFYKFMKNQWLLGEAGSNIVLTGGAEGPYIRTGLMQQNHKHAQCVSFYKHMQISGRRLFSAHGTVIVFAY